MPDTECETILDSASLIIEDGLVTRIVKSDDLGHVSPEDQVIDASGLALYPGLISGHHHLYQSGIRGSRDSLQGGFSEWLSTHHGYWETLSRTAILTFQKYGLLEALLSGVTTVIDHHTTRIDPWLTDELFSVAARLGVRLVLVRGLRDSGDRRQSSGGKEIRNELLKSTQELLEKFHDADHSSYHQIAIGPASLLGVDLELSKELTRMAQSYNSSIHTHFAEYKGEGSRIEAKTGMSRLEYLDATGWLEVPLTLVHGVHISESELDDLSGTGVGFVHCSSSNARLAVGTANLQQWSERQFAVGLGLDGAASNEASSMLAELRTAFLVQRAVFGNLSLSPNDILWMATQGGALACHRPRFGALAPGAPADIVGINVIDPPLALFQDPIAALVMGASSPVDLVVTGGELRVINGVPIAVDIGSLKEEVLRESAKMWDYSLGREMSPAGGSPPD